MTLTGFFAYAVHRRQMRYNKRDYSPATHWGNWEHTQFALNIWVDYVIDEQHHPRPWCSTNYGIPGLTAGASISMDDWDGTISQMAMGAFRERENPRPGTIRYNEENRSLEVYNEGWQTMNTISNGMTFGPFGGDYDSYPVF